MKMHRKVGKRAKVDIAHFRGASSGKISDFKVGANFQGGKASKKLVLSEAGVKTQLKEKKP